MKVELPFGFRRRPRGGGRSTGAGAGSEHAPGGREAHHVARTDERIHERVSRVWREEHRDVETDWRRLAALGCRRELDHPARVPRRTTRGPDQVGDRRARARDRIDARPLDAADDRGHPAPDDGLKA